MNIGILVRKAWKPIATSITIISLLAGYACARSEPVNLPATNPTPTEVPAPQSNPIPEYTLIPTPEPKPILTPIPTETLEPIAPEIPEPAPEPDPTSAVTEQSLYDINFSLFFVTDNKSSLESIVEFDFGSDVFLNYTLKKTNQTDKEIQNILVIEYTAPNGAKNRIEDAVGYLRNTGNVTKFDSVCLNLKEILGTLEPGQHDLTARIIMQQNEIATQSLTFTVQDPPTTTVDGVPIKKPVYTQEEWDYFEEIAFGPDQYGAHGEVIKKWSKSNPPKIYVHGSKTNKNIKPSEESINTLEKLVQELKELTKLDIQYADNPSKANFHVYLDVPDSDLHRIVPEIKEGTYGGGYYIYDSIYWIHGARIAVSNMFLHSEPFPRCIIDNYIYQEVTQSLGLTKDSDKYPSSIFQQDFPSEIYDQGVSPNFLPIGRRIIQLLYETVVKPDMTPSQVRNLIYIVNP